MVVVSMVGLPLPVLAARDPHRPPAKVDIVAVIRSRTGGRDEEWHSAQARARHTDSSVYVWLGYATIRSLSRPCRFR